MTNEIKIAQIPIEESPKKVEKRLNKPANEGWFLIAVVEAFGKDSSFRDYYNYIFQRPMESIPKTKD